MTFTPLAFSSHQGVGQASAKRIRLWQPHLLGTLAAVRPAPGSKAFLWLWKWCAGCCREHRRLGIKNQTQERVVAAHARLCTHPQLRTVSLAEARLMP